MAGRNQLTTSDMHAGSDSTFSAKMTLHSSHLDVLQQANSRLLGRCITHGNQVHDRPGSPGIHLTGA